MKKIIYLISSLFILVGLAGLGLGLYLHQYVNDIKFIDVINTSIVKASQYIDAKDMAFKLGSTVLSVGVLIMILMILLGKRKKKLALEKQSA